LLGLIKDPVKGRAYAGQHGWRFHREAAVSLFQAFARFKRTFIEQRRSIREYVDFPGLIDVGDGSQLRSCTVLDVSEDGARVIVASSAVLPKEFWLILNKDGTRRRRCRMVWRSVTQVGVQYLGAIQSDFLLH
jgi:hypothetical protein